MDFWRDSADKILHDLNTWSERTDSQLVVEFKKFYVRSDKSTWKTPYYKLVSCPNTETKHVLESTLASITSPTVISSPTLYTRDFDSLADNPPFRVSLAGTVAAKQSCSVT